MTHRLLNLPKLAADLAAGGGEFTRALQQKTLGPGHALLSKSALASFHCRHISDSIRSAVGRSVAGWTSVCRLLEPDDNSQTFSTRTSLWFSLVSGGLLRLACPVNLAVFSMHFRSVCKYFINIFTYSSVLTALFVSFYSSTQLYLLPDHSYK